ncbi:hypothetical protein [Streptomyces tuirus]|uniref:Uncharacterized protein n=1 Tax=Streptomyces tuirus TaxID=68278 RepID=A0A7G1NDU8_9ACTN|nr:hypothetical protein [Streptomyces tuirus]BCL20921.1 hypothetical protein GCM10017668_27640 [Streptomyces tuirus]
MTTNKGRKRRSAPEQSPGTAHADSTHPAAPGPGGPQRRSERSALVRRALVCGAACARLLRLKKAENDHRVERRRAHVDDVLRVVRNLAALVLFTTAVSTLVAYAGIRMGVPPEICWIGSVGSGPMLVRSFIRLFETVRPLLPDAPEDPPSTDGP